MLGLLLYLNLVSQLPQVLEIAKGFDTQLIVMSRGQISKQLDKRASFHLGHEAPYTSDKVHCCQPKLWSSSKLPWESLKEEGRPVFSVP